MVDSPAKIKCLIVDDEPNAIKILKEYFKEFDDLELAGTASNAFDALAILQNGAIDLLFLDVQMPMITGMQLLKTLKNAPAVIITTAHREYAADAFDFQVLDYLLKPISPERFSISVKRFFQSANKLVSPVPDNGSDGDILIIRSERREMRVPVDEILYLQALGDYVAIFLESGTKHLTLGTLTGIFSRLPENKFARIHRSFIVNKRQIRAISKDKLSVGKTSLPLGKNYRPFRFKL